VIGLVVWFVIWATAGMAEDEWMPMNYAITIIPDSPEIWTIEWEPGSMYHRCRLTEPRKYECEKVEYDDPIRMGCWVTFSGHWVCP
jgi:hypothetical protein